jgi:hypothetical protein
MDTSSQKLNFGGNVKGIEAIIIMKKFSKNRKFCKF